MKYSRWVGIFLVSSSHSLVISGALRIFRVGLRGAHVVEDMQCEEVNSVKYQDEPRLPSGEEDVVHLCLILQKLIFFFFPRPEWWGSGIPCPDRIRIWCAGGEEERIPIELCYCLATTYSQAIENIPRIYPVKWLNSLISPFGIENVVWWIRFTGDCPLSSEFIPLVRLFSRRRRRWRKRYDEDDKEEAEPVNWILEF